MDINKEDAPDHESPDELHSDEKSVQENRRITSAEEWWNTMSYPDPHISER